MKERSLPLPWSTPDAICRVSLILSTFTVHCDQSSNYPLSTAKGCMRATGAARPAPTTVSMTASMSL